MKILFLTTDTIHHCYFIDQIKKFNDNFFIILENIKNSNLNSIEKKRRKFEKLNWYKNKKYISIENKYKNQLITTNNINSKKVIKLIKNLKPELVISFGVSKLSKNIIDISKNKIFNIHGGDVEKYRGLDSHPWSVYHSDLKSLKVTIHAVSEVLDGGKIYKIKKIDLNKNSKYFHLRYLTTNLAIKIILELIIQLRSNKKIILQKNNKPGRYYSNIPYEIESNLIKKFRNIIKKKYEQN